MTGAAAFYLVAAGAVASALGVVASRNVVHAVLLMVVNFVLTALLYLMLHAPFIAMAQVTVYAGAIMVLFLFVVMLLGEQRTTLDDPLVPQRLLGVPLLVLLAALLLGVVVGGVPGAGPDAGTPAPAASVAPDFGSPAASGDALFRTHVLAFELVSVLLLVALLGAVIIARFRGARASAGQAAEGDG